MIRVGNSKASICLQRHNSRVSTPTGSHFMWAVSLLLLTKRNNQLARLCVPRMIRVGNSKASICLERHNSRVSTPTGSHFMWAVSLLLLTKCNNQLARLCVPRMIRVGNSKASICLERHNSRVSTPTGSRFISLTMQLG